MSDYMLLEYLRNKGMRDDEHKLLNDFKDYMHSKRGKMRGSMYHKDYDWDDMEFEHSEWDSDSHDSYKARGYRDSRESHFDEFEAKEIVSEMFHSDMNNKRTGEHFDMRKAKEVFDKYKNQFVIDASPAEVYIAINATYHDFCKVLRSWFGGNIDDKVILLAVTFWFKDEDYKGNKVMDYFM